MKTVYLHAGLHKTGTSSIQKFLSINTNALRDQSYVYFTPDPWPIPFKHEPRIDLCLAGLNDIKNCAEDNVILSHENYSWLFEKEKLEELYLALSKVSDVVKVVIYVRRQDSLAVSQKQEGTKWVDNSVAYGHELSALPIHLNYYTNHYLNFFERIDAWKKVFGENNVIVKVFDKEKLLNNDVVDDFCNVVGLKVDASFSRVGHINESITRKKQLFLHYTRKYFDENTPEKHSLVKRVLSLDIDDKEKLLPSRKNAMEFYNKFTVSNSRLASVYLNTSEKELFSNDFTMYPVESNEKFTEEEINQVYIALIKSLLAEVNAVKQELKDDNLAEQYRDMALRVEKNHPYVALKLMSRAHALKPEGPFILEKLNAYKKAINKNKGA